MGSRATGRLQHRQDGRTATDLPVPRSPMMRTPPMFGSMTFKIKACFISSCPAILVKGKGGRFTVVAGACAPAATPLRRPSFRTHAVHTSKRDTRTRLCVCGPQVCRARGQRRECMVLPVAHRRLLLAAPLPQFVVSKQNIQPQN